MHELQILSNVSFRSEVVNFSEAVNALQNNCKRWYECVKNYSALDMPRYI